MVSKEELRGKTRQLRDDMASNDAVTKSKKIINKLLSLEEVRRAKVIALYCQKGNEVHTLSLIDYLCDKTIVAPFVEGSTMEMARVRAIQDLEDGKYGIKEPINRNIFEQEIDIVIVPALALGLDMNRVGYGKGYYDRYLASFKGLKIALGYDFQVFDTVETEEHDIGMDYIITESRIIK